MRIEALCTGDELLTGVTTDTNSTWFQERLLEHGEPGEPHDHRGRRPGGDPRRAADALRPRGRGAGLGGLGPTADDLTAEVAAQAAGVPLVQHAGALAALKERFAVRGLTVTENNMKQALVPDGAEVVLNPAGTAPMFVLPAGEGGALLRPRRSARVPGAGGDRGAPSHRRAPGRAGRDRLPRAPPAEDGVLPESHLDARVRPLLALHPQVTFGFRTHSPENHLKLMAEGRTQEEALEALEAADAASRPLLGDHLFAVDDDTMAGVVGRQLLGRRETLALAESCTGGRIGDMLTDVAGRERVLPRERGHLRQRRSRSAGLAVAHATLVANGAVSRAGGGGDGAGRAAGGRRAPGPSR